MEPIEFYLESFTNPPKWVRKALGRAILGPGRESGKEVWGTMPWMVSLMPDGP